MKLTRRVWFNEVPLDEVHESVVIRGVDTGVSHETISAVNLMGGFGQRITSQHWETLDCSVSYAINKPKNDLQGRRQVFDAVNTWAANTGWLRTTERHGQRMWVDKVIIPGAGDLWDWTREYTIVFRAYSVPFWQKIVSSSEAKQFPMGSGTITLEVDGNVQTVLNANIRNGDMGTLNGITISTGESTIELSGIEWESNEYIYISHGNDGLLRIGKGGTHPGTTSIYDKRSADSSDDLYINPGSNTISFTATGTIAPAVYAYGRYL